MLIRRVDDQNTHVLVNLGKLFSAQVKGGLSNQRWQRYQASHEKQELGDCLGFPQHFATKRMEEV